MTAPRLLIVQHEDDCPPEWFGAWFTECGVECDVVLGQRGEAVPSDLDGYDGLVVLGGEMGAYDDHSYPWLGPTKTLIAGAVATGKCFLGICLGHQLAAVALGGEVTINPLGRATALARVRLTRAGLADELTAVIPDGARSIQWNSDVVSRLPAGAIELATAPDGSNQAARFGPRAWGVQFHPEASPAQFDGWIETAAQTAADAPALTAVAAEILSAEAELRQTWSALARRWAELVATPIPVP